MPLIITTMREIEASSSVFVRQLATIMQMVEQQPQGLTIHAQYRGSNNKLKIVIAAPEEEKRKLICIFYEHQPHFFRVMERNIEIHELRLMIELVIRDFTEEEHLIRNAHISLSEELYYYNHMDQSLLN